jgi:hypothetical protein
MPFAKILIAGYFRFAMSTLVEIQDAVAQLSGDERKALQVWLNSQGNLGMTAREEQRLLSSLDAAIRDIDDGNGVSIGDVRKRVASWVVK